MKKKKKEKKLTAMQGMVIDNLEKGMGDREACEKAGYSAKTVNRRKREIFGRIGGELVELARFKGKNKVKSSKNKVKKGKKKGKKKDKVETLPIELEACDPASITLVRLKPRQIKYFLGLAEGKAKNKAATDAGYSESYARNA